MDAAVLCAAGLGMSLFLGLLVMMASHELAFCPVRSVDPKLREKANIQSNIYLGVKSGSRPLPGFTMLLAALLLTPREGAPLFCCLLLGLAAVPYTPAVVPGPPTSQLYGEALLGSCVPLASYKTLS